MGRTAKLFVDNEESLSSSNHWTAEINNDHVKYDGILICNCYIQTTEPRKTSLFVIVLFLV